MYHPRIKQIIEDNADFVQNTNTFSIRAERDMLEYCLDNKINIIHVGTMRVYEYVKEIVIDVAKGNGYNIEVYALAVPNIESKISAKSREREQINNRKPVRKTSNSFIDEADAGFKRSISILSASKDIDDIKILIRGKTANDEPILVYTQGTDSTERYKNAYDALVNERIKQINRKRKINEMDAITRKEEGEER